MTVIVKQEIGQQLRVKVAPSDLVQESLLEAYRGFATFKGTTQPELLNWLKTTLLNNLTDARRRYHGTASRAIGRECPIEADSAAPDMLTFLSTKSALPIEKVIRSEQYHTLLAALRDLPERQRRAILFRNFESKSFAEIGELLQISTDAARKLWERAIERLSDRIRRDDTSSPIS